MNETKEEATLHYRKELEKDLADYAVAIDRNILSFIERLSFPIECLEILVKAMEMDYRSDLAYGFNPDML